MEDISKIRVRYAETDQMGVVYYANYFVWMEVGRTNLLRNSGLSYKELEKEGYALPVLKAYAEYLNSAHYDEEVIIKSKFKGLQGPKFTIEYEIYDTENSLLVRGYTEHVFISKETRKVVKPPKKFLELIKKEA
ncbi:MAG: acyl-CoA thioesterase [Brevinematales bacterium]|nr:acyl-CoA thioesterase [Brevinematales bacterium]